MNLYLLFIIIVSLIGIKVFFKDSNNDYLSKENTTCVKGIFTLIIFYSHCCTYIKTQMSKDFMMLNFRNFLGQLMVTMFLFYSGYGIYESIKKKKNKYIETIPKNRILKTLLHFDIIVLIFALVNYLTGNPKSLLDILWALTGWGEIGNSNWYIFAILCLYLSTYFSFKIFENDNKKAILFNWILTTLLMMIIWIYRGANMQYCYNTLLCYPLGLTYSYYKEDINKIVFTNSKYIMLLFIVCISFFTIRKIADINTLYYSISSILFVFLIILISVKVKFNSPILKWFGDNLFYIYMLQRLPMIIFSRIGLAGSHAYRFALICFILTVLITFIISKLMNIFDKKVLKV